MPSCPMGTFLYAVRPGDTLWTLAKLHQTTIYAIAAVNPGINLSRLSVGQPLCIPGGYERPRHIVDAQNTISVRQLNLNNLLRMLWEHHVAWTRMVILSIVFGLPDAEQSTMRLLRNPRDFEAALTPLYGNAAASQFSDLLTSHLVIASQLVKAAKAGDNITAAALERNWYGNADEIAAFLARINPYWSEQDWKKMLYEHLALTKTEAVDMLNKNYSDSISTYDKVERQALEMADMMRDGIVRQFPDQFR